MANDNRPSRYEHITLGLLLESDPCDEIPFNLVLSLWCVVAREAGYYDKSLQLKRLLNANFGKLGNRG